MRIKLQSSIHTMITMSWGKTCLFCLSMLIIVSGNHAETCAQNSAPVSGYGYSQAFTPYQQAGFANYQSAGNSYSDYSSAESGSESQISYEYIDRQRQHGKYARESYVNGETPFDNAFKTVLKSSWVQLEYLNWSIKGPGNKSLGAPTLLTTGDPANPFEATPDQYGGLIDVITSVPDVSRIELPNNNGFRASAGVDLSFGELEASIFVLQQADSLVDFTHFINNTAFVPRTISQTYLEQGQVSDLNINYDLGYYMAYTSQLFGADANLYLDVRNVDLGLNHDAIIGFKYINLQERLQQHGQFDNFGTIAVTHFEYDSSTTNNVFGPQVGWRSEFKHQFFTLGIDNKVMAGFNNHQASLVEASYDVNGGGFDSFTRGATQFAVAYDLNVYGKIKISEHFKINVGYDFLWLGRVTRPADNIVYDTDNTLTIDSRLEVNDADMYIHGLSVGTEITF